MVTQPPTPPPGPSSVAPPPVAPGAHIDDMNSAAAPSLTVLSDATRDQVVAHAMGLFGPVAGGELLAYAASLATKADLEREIRAVRGEIATLRIEIAGMKVSMIKWMVSMQVATIGILIGAMGVMYR